VGPDAVTGIVVERHLVLHQHGRTRRAQGAEVRSERPHRGESVRQLALVQASRTTRVRAHRERRHTTRRPAERDDAPTTICPGRQARRRDGRTIHRPTEEPGFIRWFVRFSPDRFGPWYEIVSPDATTYPSSPRYRYVETNTGSPPSTVTSSSTSCSRVSLPCVQGSTPWPAKYRFADSCTTAGSY